MYCQHFNLKKKPFQLSCDNSFLWLGQSHAKAIDELKQGIEGPDRLLVFTGDVGTGKTTLLNEIIQTLPPDTDHAHITDPSLEIHYLFLSVARGLGFENMYQEGEKFTPILKTFLKRTEQRGRRALIIIDEAHLVPDRFLAQLISWSRLNTGHALTIILAGQLEFHEIIAKFQGRSWKDHVDVHAMLAPLNEKETQAYINQRLALAGARRKIFIIPAVHQVYLFSKGVPRLINTSCDQAMIAAFSKGMKIIDASTFQEAVGILELPHVPDSFPEPNKKSDQKKSRRSRKLVAGLAATVILGIGAYYVSPWHSPVVSHQIAARTMDETKKELSPPVVEEAQAEFYSPPEKNEFTLASVPVPVPEPESEPEPLDIKKFINEVFMIHDPVGHGAKATQQPQANAANVPPPSAPVSPPPSRFGQKTPEPDAIIDWLLNKK